MTSVDPTVPGAAPAPRRSSGTGAFLSIGEVLSQLRAEFPDVTISKIRFLETEGLVEPERASSGYRKFSRADVDRLRFVLSAQRDRYLPLKVIREQLGDSFVDSYCKLKHADWNAYSRHLTEWERQNTLDC